ncbi:MAG: hypothetical protein ACJAVI_004264 [Candidatus Azotimanducaceae bacterium]|jgi:hypothetical protein
MLSALIATSGFCIPTQAAVIDTVKDKVVAIKKETSIIKKRVQEVALTANANIRETIDIRGALDPLFGMREKFEELGLDPAELLDSLPDEEIRAMIDNMREQKAERQAMRAENVEPFRAEFLEALEGINSIVRDESSAIQASPLQTLIENAPQPVIAVIRAITAPFFEELTVSIINTKRSMDELQSLGAFDALALVSPVSYAPIQKSSMMKIGLTKKEKNDLICTLVGNAKPLQFALWQYIWRTDELLSVFKVLKDKLINKSEDATYELQIHGYLKFLTFRPLNKVVGSLDLIEVKLERRKMRMEHIKGLIEYGRDWGGCELIRDSIDSGARDA